MDVFFILIRVFEHPSVILIVKVDINIVKRVLKVLGWLVYEIVENTVYKRLAKAMRFDLLKTIVGINNGL